MTFVLPATRLTAGFDSPAFRDDARGRYAESTRPMTHHHQTHTNTPGCECCRRRLLAGARLRRYRMARGLTQAQLADQLGVSDRLVSGWERGESLPGLWPAFHLAQAFNRQVVDLFLPIHDFVRQNVDDEPSDVPEHGSP